MEEPRSTHECFVCGDTIDLSAQVCSRFCMRALEQMTELDCLDSLEAQVESSPSPSYEQKSASDYESPTLYESPTSYGSPTLYGSLPTSYGSPSTSYKVVPEQREVPILIEVENSEYTWMPRHKSY